MTKQIWCFLLLIVVLAGTLQAQEIKVNQFDFATSVENRSPMGVDTSFTADVGTVFCFTQITDAPDTSQISHVWYYKDEEKARIDLDVKAGDWRTWSSKSILNNWSGPWRVIIEDDNGNVLAAKTFTITDN